MDRSIDLSNRGPSRTWTQWRGWGEEEAAACHVVPLMAPSWSSSPLAGVRLTPGKDPLLDAGDAHMRRRTTRQQGPKRFQKKTPRIFNNRAGHWIRSTHTHPTPCYCSRQPRTWPPSVSRDLRISLRRAYVREKKRTRAQQSASCSVACSTSKQWIEKPKPPIDGPTHERAHRRP
jgi:hypothetical protein